MKPIKLPFWKRVLIGAVAAVASVTGLANIARGEGSGTFCNPVTFDNFAKNKYSIRSRLENFDGEDEHLNKGTFGIAPVDGKYNRFAEMFRSYHFNGEENRKDIDWNSWGLIIPRFKSGGSDGLEHSISVFGESGDKQGIGTEAITRLPDLDLDLYVNAEKSFSGDSRRLGFGFEHGFGETWNFGAGVDKVDTPQGDATYTSGKAIWNMDKNNQIGSGIRLSNNDIGTNKLAAYFMRHGDVKWGNRSIFIYDWKDGFKKIHFRSTFAENPTFSRKGSGPAFVGRNQGYILSPHVINSPVTTIEPPTVVERSKKGLAARILGDITTTDQRKGFIEADLGYQFGNLGIYGFHKNGFGGVSDFYGAHAVLKLDETPLKVPLKLEAGYEKFKDGREDRSYVSLSAYIPVGGK